MGTFSFSPRQRDFLDKRIQKRFASRGQHEPGAFLREQPSCCMSDSGACARDDGDFIGECRHWPVLIRTRRVRGDKGGRYAPEQRVSL
jgi:hypothetical protein